MKSAKIFLSLMALMCALSAHGANICIKNDVVMVVLDPQISGTSLASNATGKTWSTQFSYGVINGIGGCSRTAGPTSGIPAGTVATDQTAVTTVSVGTACYCKMLRPVESPWVYSGYTDGDIKCTPNCAQRCATNVGTTLTLRAGLFGNAGI